MPTDDERRQGAALRYLYETGQLRDDARQGAPRLTPGGGFEPGRGDDAGTQRPVFNLPAGMAAPSIPGGAAAARYQPAAPVENVRGVSTPTSGATEQALPAPPPLPDYLSQLLADARARLAAERAEAERQLRFAVGRQGITQGSAHRDATADVERAASTADTGARTFATENRRDAGASAPASLGNEFARITGRFRPPPPRQEV